MFSCITRNVDSLMFLFFCQPDVTDGSQSEVKVKPVPRPRTRIQPKSQCNNNNSTVDPADTTSNTTNAVVSRDIVSKINSR